VKIRLGAGGCGLGSLTGAKADERQVLLSILDDTGLAALLPGQTLIGDKNYYGRDFEAALGQAGLHLLRPARQGEPARPGAQFFRPLRQTIESVNDTLKGQLDLERHGGHTPAGVITRVLQRILALTAAIWHNDHTGQPSHLRLLLTPWNRSSSGNPAEGICWRGFRSCGADPRGR